MKIEKMNDHQIRCTLTREDLAMRQIKLSELAYGSEKTKLLFRDMMQQAALDFGFEAEDIPLMIEAIPLSPEKIVLIITKVESPDELDTRFSNFTQIEDEDEEAPETEEDMMMRAEDAASELLDLFEQIKKEKQLSDAKAEPDKSTAAETEQTRLYAFSDLETAITTAHKLGSFYTGQNSLYRDPQSGRYYLVLEQSSHSVSDFSRINNLLSAYMKPLKYSPGAPAYYQEHFREILSGNALQTLAEIR